MFLVLRMVDISHNILGKINNFTEKQKLNRTYKLPLFKWHVVLSTVFLHYAQYCNVLWPFKVNYRFRQIHGAPTKMFENCSIVIFAQGVPPKLYFFKVNYRKSTRLAEILTFYFWLFSPATLYYRI